MISRTHLIRSKDPEYYKFLYNKRVAIVGPSINTLNSNQGKNIDSYDIVVRLNKSLPIPKNKVKDIGYKTDILYNSFNLKDYPGENKLKINILKKKIKFICSPYPFIYPFSNDILNFISNNNGNIPIHLIDLVLYKYICSILKCRPYTGTSAIIDLLQFPIKELYITGIDCYLCNYYKEYRNISKYNLKNLQNNNIHNNKPQLILLKNLILNDNRIKIDNFLNNYFFKKDYIIFNTIKSIENIFINYNTINNLSDIINIDIPILYSNSYHNNCFIVSDSLNYNNLDGNSNIYFNFNNSNIKKKSVNINNNIKVLIDFNINKSFVESIKNNTDIENIYIISFEIVKKFLSLNKFKNINYRFIVINLLINLLNRVLYINFNIIKEFTNNEKEYLYFLQYNKKIKIINIK